MKSLIEELNKIGVSKVVICPGGRNKPLIDLFENDARFEIESFFDERSAAFYALGLATQGAPVVVLTTSGSAVAECLPAVIEAQYQCEELPLIIMSADRPVELRYTGSPQTIPQQNIFGDFVESKFDIQNNEEVNLGHLTYPAHINICVNEPNAVKNHESKFNLDSLVILSSVKESDLVKVRKLLKDFSGVVVLEALSNFKENDFSKEAIVVRLPDQFFNKIGVKSFNKVLRIGAVPVLKVFREIDLVQSYYLEGYHKGSSKSQSLSFKEVEAFIKTSQEQDSSLHAIRALNVELNKKNQSLIKTYEQSEISILAKLVDVIPDSATVFVGNSLPIRELQHTRFDKGFKIIGQRGVNGIDGSLSFALGSTLNEKEVWVLLGDLTCLYDLQGFWPLLSKTSQKVRIVVINNFGGQIFKKIFNKDSMLNSHSLDFSHIAKFWKMDYSKSFEDFKAEKILIELNPVNNETLSFLEEIEK